MSGSSSHISTLPRDFKLIGPFERYWKSEPDFSEAKLETYRNKTARIGKVSWPTSRKSEDDLFSDQFHPSQRLRNQIHPFFQPANFVTGLPLGEVSDVLQPALQMVSNFLTDDCALEWFVHVRFATLLPTEYRPGMLIRRAEPITKDKLDTVKNEIRELAGRVHISFASLAKCRLTKGAIACATQKQSVNLTIVNATQAELALYGKHGETYQPMIFLNVDLFHEAMTLHYHDTTPAEKRCFALSLVSSLIHEFAHVWTGLCHPRSRKLGEPFISPTDMFPEAGFSWEQHMFGSHLLFKSGKPVLRAESFASQFLAPRHNINSFVPMSYVNKWFLASTWDNFNHLHSTGALLAPSPDRDASCVIFRRYCPTVKALVCPTYINGAMDSKPYCSAVACNIRFPHDDPAAFRTQLLDVLERDIELANADHPRHHNEVEEDLRGPRCTLYDAVTARMDAPLLGQEAFCCGKSRGGKASILRRMGFGRRKLLMVKRDDVFDL